MVFERKKEKMKRKQKEKRKTQERKKQTDTLEHTCYTGGGASYFIFI